MKEASFPWANLLVFFGLVAAYKAFWAAPQGDPKRLRFRGEVLSKKLKAYHLMGSSEALSDYETVLVDRMRRGRDTDTPSAKLALVDALAELRVRRRAAEKRASRARKRIPRVIIGPQKVT